MSSFFINLGEKQFESEGDVVVSGLIKIDGFEENFCASLSYWDRDKYLSQWKEALGRLLNGENCSAIITTMYDPKKANFIFWWIIYLVEDNAYIQNHVLFLDELQQPFDESDIYRLIPPREIHTEDGELISEWVVKISDIKKCFYSLQGQNWGANG